jgi:hypothetical protein
MTVNKAVTNDQERRGVIDDTLYVIIFHIFPVLVKLNVTVRKSSNTLGLQRDIQKFDAINKWRERRFP